MPQKGEAYTCLYVSASWRCDTSTRQVQHVANQGIRNSARTSGPPAAEMEGRFPFTAERFEPISRDVTYTSGSVRIPTDQPLGELASVLLEARSGDSLPTWGFFPEILQRTEYIDGYVIAPLADRMLESNPELAREFNARSRLRQERRCTARPVLRTHAFVRSRLRDLSRRRGIARCSDQHKQSVASQSLSASNLAAFPAKPSY